MCSYICFNHFLLLASSDRAKSTAVLDLSKVFFFQDLLLNHVFPFSQIARLSGSLVRRLGSDAFQTPEC